MRNYNELNDVIWGCSDTNLNQLLHVPGDDGAGHSDPDGWEFNDMTQTQLKRIQRQAHSMLFWFGLRVEQLKLMVKHFDTNQKDSMRDFYIKYPAFAKNALLETVCKRTRICVKTFRKWRNEYLEYNGKFKRDERGCAQFGWILVNEDKKKRFTNWLKCQKELDILTATDYVNTKLLSEFPIGRQTNYGRLTRPTVPSTVHRWMKYCGCSYEENTKSYITDGHQRHSTLCYRIRFTDLDYFLSMRMHRWVCFPQSVLRKLKMQHEDWPDDKFGHRIPISDVGKLPPGTRTVSITCIMYTVSKLSLPHTSHNMQVLAHPIMWSGLTIKKHGQSTTWILCRMACVPS